MVRVVGSGAEGHGFESRCKHFFSWKIHVGLWEKFVGLKITVKYPQIHWKIPADTLEKNTGLFAEVPCLTTSI